MVFLAEEIEPKADGVVEELLAVPLRGTIDEAEQVQVHWMKGKPVRHFDIPKRGEVPEQDFLEFMLELVQDFQTRFERMADGADEVRYDSQERLDRYQAEYDKAVELGDQQWQVTALAQSEIAKYLFGMDAAQKHIEMRMPERRTSVAQMLDITGEEIARDVVQAAIPEALFAEAKDKEKFVDAVYEAIIKPTATQTTKRGLLSVFETEAPEALKAMALEKNTLPEADLRDASFAIAREVRDVTKSQLKEATLKVLQKRAEKGINDVAEALGKGEIKLKGGATDIDEVLNEAKGEPLNAFMGTLGKNGEGYMRGVFYENRFKKVVGAWDQKDKIVGAMHEVIDKSRFAESDKQRLKEASNELGDAMEARSETLRGQDGFARASQILRARRDEFNQFDPSEKLGRAGNIYGPLNDKSMNLLREGMELIYDMAHIRGAKQKSTSEFLEAAHEMTKFGKVTKYADPELKTGNDGQLP